MASLVPANNPLSGINMQSALAINPVQQVSVPNAIDKGIDSANRQALDRQTIDTNAFNQGVAEQDQQLLQQRREGFSSANTIEDYARVLANTGDIQGSQELLQTSATFETEKTQALTEAMNEAGRMLSLAKTPEQAVAVFQEIARNNPPLAARMVSPDSLLSQGMMEINRETPDLDTFTRTNLDGSKERVVQPKVEGVTDAGQATGGIQFNSDGTVSSIGGVSGGGGGRDLSRMGRNLSDADASLLETGRSSATSADDMITLADQMGILQPQLGYTGVGGDFYHAADKVLGNTLPGDVAAREAFHAKGVDAQLMFVERTKGAISNKEMALFKEAVPGLTITQPGNELLINIMRAGAQRVKQRSFFYEDFLFRQGDLHGAQRAWNSFINDNPIFLEDKESIMRISPLPSFEEYLPASNREVPINSPGFMRGASTNALEPTPPSTIPTISSPAEFDALDPGDQYINARTGKPGRKP